MMTHQVTTPKKREQEPAIAKDPNEPDIQPYDPNTQRRVVRERLQSLEIINERFARQFRMGLFNMPAGALILLLVVLKSTLITTLLVIYLYQQILTWCI